MPDITMTDYIATHINRAYTVEESNDTDEDSDTLPARTAVLTSPHGEALIVFPAGDWYGWTLCDCPPEVDADAAHIREHAWDIAQGD